MTRQTNKRKVLGRETFLEVKKYLKDNSVADAAKKFSLGETTIRRIKKSNNFKEYKGYIAASHGNKQFNEDEFELQLDDIKGSFKENDSIINYQDEEITPIGVFLILLCVVIFFVILSWVVGGIL